jgi:hypothetical protein
VPPTPEKYPNSESKSLQGRDSSGYSGHFVMAALDMDSPGRRRSWDRAPQTRQMDSRVSIPHVFPQGIGHPGPGKSPFLDGFGLPKQGRTDMERSIEIIGVRFA